MVWHPIVDLFVPGYFLRIQSLTITFVVGEPSASTASFDHLPDRRLYSSRRHFDSFKCIPFYSTQADHTPYTSIIVSKCLAREQATKQLVQVLVSSDFSLPINVNGITIHASFVIPEPPKSIVRFFLTLLVFSAVCLIAELKRFWCR